MQWVCQTRLLHRLVVLAVITAGYRIVSIPSIPLMRRTRPALRANLALGGKIIYDFGGLTHLPDLAGIQGLDRVRHYNGKWQATLWPLPRSLNSGAVSRSVQTSGRPCS